MVEAQSPAVWGHVHLGLCSAPGLQSRWQWGRVVPAARQAFPLGQQGTSPKISPHSPSQQQCVPTPLWHSSLVAVTR